MLDEREVQEIISQDLHCVHDFDLSCDMCRLRGMCLPAAISPQEIEALESLIENRIEVPARKVIYSKGQPFTHIFAVVYGAVKTYSTDQDNQTCVTGLHLPGEVFGFSGINEGAYAFNASALEDSGICAIPFDELENCCRILPGLQLRLLHLMSDRINDYQQHFAHLSSANATQRRVATFLISLLSRVARHGNGHTNVLRLPMSGDDIASYLGIKGETLSREFSRLVREGTIAKSGREVTILDKAVLERSACDRPDGDR